MIYSWNRSKDSKVFKYMAALVLKIQLITQSILIDKYLKHI